jgi:NADH-quinone oxidoreductase subunit E
MAFDSDSSNDRIRASFPQRRNAMEIAKVDTIIDSYRAEVSSLLAIMQDVQDEARYLPREAMQRVAERLSIPIARVYRMATFFESFHL